MHIATGVLFSFYSLPFILWIVPGENKSNSLGYCAMMAALFLWSVWASVYLQGLFLNRAGRVYTVRELPLPSQLSRCHMLVVEEGECSG